MEKFKIVILISGRGSNLNAIVKNFSKKNSYVEVIGVISNKPSASGLKIKGKFQKKIINEKNFSKKGFEIKLQEYLKKLNPDLICLAGFMKILSPFIINKWKNKIVNVHPSLLPSFKGLSTHNRVIKQGVKISGCSIHYVDSSLDGGPVIAQAAIVVESNINEKELSKKILKLEHDIYPKVIDLIAKKKISIINNKVVVKTKKHINAFIKSV